jgi:phenylpropionate dioxygenase-like ring-hydroxylating dioxygenase large terminal subunit
MFLRNAWYVAAWSSEVNDQLFTRRILDTPILLYRKTDGGIAAITDRCPHRFAPLHMGKRRGDVIQCGYHGLCFDATGTCIENPVGNKLIPKAAKVASFPVVERDQLIWVWMGEVEQADTALIPNFGILSSPDWVHGTGGYLHADCHYELMVDNLMDLSHVNFLHPAFGNETMLASKSDVVDEGRKIHANLWMPNTDVPAFMRDSFVDQPRIDQWLDMQWTAPSALLLSFGGTTPGQAREAGIQGWAGHILTPETDRSTHYFFSMSRQGKGAEEAVALGFATQLRVFGTEDKPMVQACQDSMGDAEFWSLKPVLLSNDVAAVRVRRRLAELVKQERAAGVSTSPMSTV